MVLHFLKDRSVLRLSEEEYITILGVASGIMLALSVEAISKYRNRQNRFNNKFFKLNKETHIYNPTKESPIKILASRTGRVKGKVILICSKLNRRIVLTIKQLPIPVIFVETIGSSWLLTTNIVIIARIALTFRDVIKYLRNNEINVGKTVINTLLWVIDDEARTLIHKLAFIAVSLTTAITWTYVPVLRHVLRVWTTIVLLNVCNEIAITDGHQLRLKYGPTVTAFGLNGIQAIEHLEHPIRELKTEGEQVKGLTITLPANETELTFSAPPQNEITSILSEKANIKVKADISVLIHEKTLIEPKENVTIEPKENITIEPKENVTIETQEDVTLRSNEKTIVPKEELRKIHSTSKIKRKLQKSQTNNLQKLNEKFNPSGDDTTSWDKGDNLQNETNPTKVKEGKVR